MATYTPEPRGYELMVLLSPELGEEELEAEIARISEQIEGTGAEILRSKSTTPWGRRRLAYPIRNFQDAFYVLYSISSQPGQLDPFERDLKLNTNAIRYLLIRQEKATALEDEPEVQADEPAVGAESDDQTPDGEAGDTDTSGDEPASEAEPAGSAASAAPESDAAEVQADEVPAEASEEAQADEAPAEPSDVDQADETPADGSDEEKA
ncbi:MAG: 30S ribosomal protein S6 [Thermomicrobiaceae bacterium]